MTRSFPKDFIWGAATAAHQVEGDNTNSDYWAEELLPGSPYSEPSGTAIDHWNRFREDIALMASLGLKAYRFSVEWARIEPSRGVWSETALAHYIEVCDTCRHHGMEAVITLHHFTSPRWLMPLGGWRGAETPQLFGRYVEHVMTALRDKVRFVVTMNECNISSVIAELKPSFLRNADPALRARLSNTAWRKLAAEQCGGREEDYCNFGQALDAKAVATVQAAHVAARSAIRSVAPGVKLGLSLALAQTQAMPGGEAHALRSWERNFRQWLPTIQDDDFIGVQVYSRTVFDAEGYYYNLPGMRSTQMRSEFAPEALAAVLRTVHRDVDKPLFVTENGVATTNDQDRIEFIGRSLSAVHACIEDGVPVIGYTQWSAFDNFEWQFGYGPKFGLIAVDRTTQQRTPKPSAAYFGAICSSGVLPADAQAQVLPAAGTDVHLLQPAA